MRYSLVLVLAACSGAPSVEGPTAPPKAHVPDPGPVVDEQCLALARAGQLMATLAADVGGFKITATDADHLYIRRPGRPLTKPEGEQLWKTVSHQMFGKGGLASGGSAMSSIYKCTDVGDASCLRLDAWMCQVGVAELTERLAEAARGAGADDGELGAMVHVLEVRGPGCKAETCTPAAHYSHKTAKYDPNGGRLPVGSLRSRGRCSADADCEGAESNACLAWYLRGGGEPAIYVALGKPAFCGCVERTCTWFTQ